LPWWGTHPIRHSASVDRRDARRRGVLEGERTPDCRRPTSPRCSLSRPRCRSPEGKTPWWGVPRALRRRARRRVHWNSVPSERCNALSSLPDSASRPRASARRPPRRRAERTRGSVMTDSGDAITGWERERERGRGPRARVKFDVPECRGVAPELGLTLEFDFGTGTRVTVRDAVTGTPLPLSLSYPSVAPNRPRDRSRSPSLIRSTRSTTRCGSPCRFRVVERTRCLRERNAELIRFIERESVRFR